MKRWLAGTLFFMVLVISVIYFIIPSTYHISISLPIHARYNAAARVISQRHYWQQWWPGIVLSDSLYEYQQLHFTTGRMGLNTANVLVEKKEDKIAGTISAIFIENDSSAIEFQSQIPLSFNPISRVLLLLKARSIKKDVNEFMLAMQQKFETKRALYGIDIIQEKVKDSSLIALRRSFDIFPKSTEIYEMVQSLNNHIIEQGGVVVNPPMLNIYTEDSVQYEAMVALPVNKDLPVKAPYMLKKMVLGNILVAEVTGDIAAINKAQMELNNYVEDLQKVAPAIPYQSLVTNRLTQPDSSKWITRLYYPVLN